MKKIILLSAVLLSLGSAPAIAQDSSSGPLGDLPSVKDFLGDPKEFVTGIEAKVFPVLGQFFQGLVVTFAMSSALKAFMRR